MKISVFRGDLTESSKSPASIAKSNKQWVGTCLYQEECKLLLINCEYPIDSVASVRTGQETEMKESTGRI